MPTLASNLLIAAGGGSFTFPEDAMSPDEEAFWSDQAALLDPDAYVFTQGTSLSDTVPAGERWYLVNGWYLKVFEDGVGHWFHRQAHIGQALMLPEGFAIETSTTQANTFMYVCQPSLVTGSDARYSTDPRGLYFDRLMKIGEQTLYQLGASATGAGTVTATFPADFTDGLVMQVSAHDVAWLIMLVTGDVTGGMNTLNEIDDSSPIRFAEGCMFPFKRTQFPKVMVQGVSDADGRANVAYIKLDGIGW